MPSNSNNRITQSHARENYGRLKMDEKHGTVLLETNNEIYDSPWIGRRRAVQGMMADDGI
jgi:hypothetical protein